MVLREEPMCSGSGVQRGRSVRSFFLVKQDVIIFPVVSLLVTLKLVAAPGFGPGSVLSPPKRLMLSLLFSCIIKSEEER